MFIDCLGGHERWCGHACICLDQVDSLVLISRPFLFVLQVSDGENPR